MQNVVIPKEYEVEVISKTSLYPRTILLKVKFPIVPTYIPGQYASFIEPDTRKPFSFVGLPGTDTAEFLVGYTPDGRTRHLIEPLEVGQRFHLLSPYGRFTVDKSDDKPIIFIAGGTGIAPIHSQIKDLLASSPRPFTLIFASYDQPRLYFHNEFTQLAKEHPNFTYIPCLSQPDEAWQGQRGLVTKLVPTLIKDLPTHAFYVCGSPSLVTDMIQVLKNNQVPEPQIHFERFT